MLESKFKLKCIGLINTYRLTHQSLSFSLLYFPVAHSGYIFIPVTRRVKGYTRFVGMYVTGRRKRFQPHKVCIFLIRITNPVDPDGDASLSPHGWPPSRVRVVVNSHRVNASRTSSERASSGSFEDVQGATGLEHRVNEVVETTRTVGVTEGQYQGNLSYQVICSNIPANKPTSNLW